MTIEEFLIISDVKESTIHKRKKEIPGLTYINGEYKIIDGTRYPYNLGNSKLKEQEDKILALLKATSRNRYIDHKMLKLQKKQFERLLNELERNGYIEENGTNNPFGANAYDLTFKGAELVQLSRNKALRTLSEIAGRFAGGFAAAVTA